MADVIGNSIPQAIQIFGRAPNGTLQAVNTDGSGNISIAGGGGGGGTVTNIATTAPITGGPIATTGTIACATCTTSAASLASGNVLTGAGSQALQDSGTALSALATLVSPTFTGTPAAPTAAVSTNTTQLATTAFVLAQFAAPGAIGGTTASSGLFTSIGATGQGNFSGAGAASTASVNFTGTVFTGGSGTTTFPNVYLNYGTAPTTFSTSGTIIAINTPSGFAGNSIDIHANGGASIFSVNSTGGLSAVGVGSSGGVTNTVGNIQTAATGSFIWQARSRLLTAADGRLSLQTNAGTTFSALTFGSEVNTNVRLASSGTAFSVALGDGTAGGTLTAGNIAAMQSCGTTTTCSATAIATGARIVFGSAPLVSGTPSTATITGISPAFTSSSTYFCTVTNATTATNNLLKVANVSGSSFTITGPATITDVINYQCIGN